MSSPELERQPLPENGVGETEIYGKAQWEVGLQKIIDEAPDKMREEFEQNGQKQPWTEVFRGRLALIWRSMEKRNGRLAFKKLLTRLPIKCGRNLNRMVRNNRGRKYFAAVWLCLGRDLRYLVFSGR